VALRLAPEEPEAGPWRAELLTVAVGALTRRGPGRAATAPGRPVVLGRHGHLPAAAMGRARPGRLHRRAGGCPLLVVEGVGAGRAAAAHLIDALVWVRSDARETERRSLARVGKPGGPLTVGHLRAWMAEEMPFATAERTWERAGLIVSGTPEISCHPDTEIVVAPRAAQAAGAARVRARVQGEQEEWP
jgi:hypothetical protein